MFLAAAGMALLTGIGVDTAYASHVLPSLILIGIGFGLDRGAVVLDRDARRAAPGQRRRLGDGEHVAAGRRLDRHRAAEHAGRVGTTDYIVANGPRAAQAAVEGYTTAFWWAAAIFAVGAVVTGALLRSGVRCRARGGASRWPPEARSRQPISGFRPCTRYSRLQVIVSPLRMKSRRSSSASAFSASSAGSCCR